MSAGRNKREGKERHDTKAQKALPLFDPSSDECIGKSVGFNTKARSGIEDRELEIGHADLDRDSHLNSRFRPELIDNNKQNDVAQ